MAEIVRFEARPRPRRRSSGKGAEVILFPGVFYEYLDEQPAGKRPAGKRRAEERLIPPRRKGGGGR